METQAPASGFSKSGTGSGATTVSMEEQAKKGTRSVEIIALPYGKDGPKRAECAPTHSVTLKNSATEGFGFEVGADNVVTSVTPGSDAEKGGVAVGDKVVSLGGEPLGTPVAESGLGSAAAALAKLEVGKTTEVGLRAAAAGRGTAMLPEGTLVTVQGLVGAAQHNGKRGAVMAFDGDSGRYVVVLEDGETIKVQPKNVEPLVSGFSFPGTGGMGGVDSPPSAPPGADRVFSHAELQAMSIKQLKDLVAARGLSSEGCIEKADFVNHLFLAQPGTE